MMANVTNMYAASIHRSESNSSAKSRHADRQGISDANEAANVASGCLNLCQSVISKLRENVLSISLPFDVSTEFSTKSTVI